jgi:hypothetical protein
MMGLALAYTPTGSGIILIVITGIINSGTASSNDTLGGRYGTGTAPVNGAAVTGTRFGPAADQEYRPNATGTYGAAMAITGVVTGLTPGTPYWFDLALSTASPADAASLDNISAALIELPAG